MRCIPQLPLLIAGLFLLSGIPVACGAQAGSDAGISPALAGPGCDLAIAGVVNPVAGTVFANMGNTIRIVRIRNNGPGPSLGTEVELRASDGFTGRTAVPPLASGEEITVSIRDPTIRQTTGVTVTYTAIVDPDNLVQDSDETNNRKTSTEKTVTWNGYAGKRYTRGEDVATYRTYDLHGGLVHSFGDSAYRSGSFPPGWTEFSVTWTGADLPLSPGAVVREAWLYVPYTWDNSEEANRVTLSFNGVPATRQAWYQDRSDFGAYADHAYGLLTYEVTSQFRKGGENSAVFSRTDSNAKISMYGFTLAVVYEDPAAVRSLIFMNEGFDILGADENGYGTTPDEATAYVPFSGLTIDTSQVSRAMLTTFVPSAGIEGNLSVNGRWIASDVWDYGSAGGTQVAVDTRDIRAYLRPDGNEVAIQSSPAGATPVIAASQQFLVVELGGQGAGGSHEVPFPCAGALTGAILAFWWMERKRTSSVRIRS